jgi:hypothetical protein
MGIGAVSRYNYFKRKEFIKVQKLGKKQWRESGFITNYKFVLAAGVKAKTVTNKLPLLSVLGAGVCALGYSRVRRGLMFFE